MDLRGKGAPMADVLPKQLVVPLLDCNKVLPLRDQVEVEGVLFQECPAKVVSSLNGGHIK